MVPKPSLVSTQYQTNVKPMQAIPTTMAFQPNAAPGYLTSLHEQNTTATNMTVNSQPFTVVTNTKEKRTTGTSTNTIPSFFQRHTLPPPPVTFAIAASTDHPDAPPTKKRISTPPLQSANSPPGTPPPNLTLTTKWLCIDITITATDANHTSKDILIGFRNFTTASWLIDPFLSILPVSQTPNFLPLTQESDKFKSVQNLKHYLKNSNIATLLKQEHQDFFTLQVCIQVHSSISATSLISELRSPHPDWIIIVNPYDGMLPTPCGWLLFSSFHIQRVALASQLQSIFSTSSNIDTPLQCIWTNIQGIGDYCQSTAPAIQMKCHPTHKQAIQTLFLELISPTAIDNEDPQYIFQSCMVFMTPDMLSITDSAYASLVLDQNKCQASEGTLKVPDLSPLNKTITDSTDTLGIALTN